MAYPGGSTDTGRRSALIRGAMSMSGRVGRRSFLGAGLATAGLAAAGPRVAAAAPAGRSGGLNLSPPIVDPSKQSLVAIPPGRVRAAVASLDDIIRPVMDLSGVPGLSAAVVHKGRLLYAKGFGVRDVDTGTPVSASTVFHLASVSKSLSSTVVAGLVGRKVVSWTDPIVEHLPDFALADPYVTRHVTLADLFSHRSGLPMYAGDLLEELGFSQAYTLRTLRLEPLAPFRANYAYTNFGLTAAAVAVATADHGVWASVADDVLFHPLGMSATSFRYADFVRQRNRAAMHVRIDGKWYQKFERDADPQAPAGGASSNVLDLAKWMALRLAGGAGPNGRPLIDGPALLKTNTPQNVSSPPASNASRTGFYGLGTDLGVDYSGRTSISHSGAFSQGAATNYLLMPEQQLGIVTLTNGMPIGIPEAIGKYFMDLVVGGRIENDWYALYQGAFAQLYVNPSELAGKKPPAHPEPARSADAYIGTYANDYYGTIEVVHQGGALHVLIGPRPIDYELSHWDGDLFAFFPVGENALGISAATFTFPGHSSRARTLTLEYYDPTGLGTFMRR